MHAYILPQSLLCYYSIFVHPLRDGVNTIITRAHYHSKRWLSFINTTIIILFIVDFDALLQQSDIVIVCCALTSETKGGTKLLTSPK